MATSYGSTDIRVVNSNIQSEPVAIQAASQTPQVDGHVHDIACLLIVVVQVTTYLLLNISPFIKSPTFNTAIYIKAGHECAAVIYCSSCVAMIILMTRCIHANRMNRTRNELTSAHSNDDESSRGSMCIRHFVLTVLFLGSVTQIISFGVLSTDSDNASVFLIAFQILFCIFQLPLVIYCNRKRTDTSSRFNLYLLAFIIAGNACVCVDFVFYPFQSQEDSDGMTELYVFRVHFAVFTMFMLFNMATSRTDETPNSVNRSQNEVRNMAPARSEPTAHIRDTWFRKMMHYITATIRFICYYSLYFSLLYGVFLLSVNVAEKVNLSGGGWNDTSKNENNGTFSNDIMMLYDTTETVCVYTYSVVTLVVLIFAGLEKSVTRANSADRRMLLISLSFYTVVHLVEMVIDGNYLYYSSSRHPTTALADFILFVMFSNLGTFCQTAFILKVSGFQFVSPLTLRQIFIRGTVVFLCVFNLEKWIHDSFFFPKDYSIFLKTAETAKAWFGFASPFISMASFYRLFSAVLLYEILLSYPRE